MRDWLRHGGRTHVHIWPERWPDGREKGPPERGRSPRAAAPREQGAGGAAKGAPLSLDFVLLLNAAVACAIFTGCVMFAKNLVDNTQPAYWCTACIALFGPVGVMALNEALRL